ncbi:tetratricopeptide repeat protein [uncultured Kiloniella sp.]|uniref:tetratricopeptide repeat protein n=1 Tax=uncultured Kiloniella sp. TaxID=1133091 RepID=UPI00262917E3|nr:tetratricopeptide repeat protein [uncultured Kiloniella sp.]
MKQIRQSILMRVIMWWVAMALWTLPSFAQDFDKGLSAYLDGEYAVALKEFHMLAELGDGEAQFYLGEMYGLAHGVERDLFVARKWFLRASEQGNFDADSRLALLYLHGVGGEQSDTLALYHARRGADNNSDASQFTLAEFYEKGHAGVAQSDEDALKWYQLAADKGFTPAYLGLGRLYEKIDDIDNAKRWYQRAIDEGDEYGRKPLARLKAQSADAKQTAGNNRKVVSSSSSSSSGSSIAVEYPDEAARKSSDRVWEDDKDDFLVGANAYLDGDFSLALEFLYPLAEKGVPFAQYYMGEMFDRGLGINKNPKAAVKWFKAAYKNGVSRAGHNLAYIYFTGSAGFVDRQTALKIYHKEAKAGNSLSQVNLGHIYSTGNDVPQSDKIAVRWYSEAAKNGNPTGMFQLGLAYYHSVGGVNRDHDMAYIWFSLADEEGVEEALVYKDLLAKPLTKAQLQKANKRVTECRQRKFKGCFLL